MKLGILRSTFLILFSNLTLGAVPQDIPEKKIMKAASHTVLVLSDIGLCHGILISPYKVLTAAHCVDDIKISNLRVIVYVGSDYSDFLISQSSFREIAKIRGLMVWCLVLAQAERESLSCSRFFKSFVNRDYSRYTTVIEKKSNPRGFIAIHQTNRIYAHPSIELEGITVEDTAIIVIENPVVFHINNMASIKDHSNERVIVPANGFADDVFNTFATGLSISAEEVFSSNCFFMDWRISDSIYQTIWLTSINSSDELINHLELNIQQENSASTRPGSFFSSIPFIQVLYSILFENFYSYYTEKDFESLPGNSGGPIWCYRSDTGIFLAGHISRGVGTHKSIIVRKFDEDLYQWIKEQE